MLSLTAHNCKTKLTQTSSWVITTSPIWQAACNGLWGCSGSLSWSLVLWARSRRSLGSSLLVMALISWADVTPSGFSTWVVKGATNNFCSYFARIQDSLCSLNQKQCSDFSHMLIYKWLVLLSENSVQHLFVECLCKRWVVLVYFIIICIVVYRIQQHCSTKSSVYIKIHILRCSLTLLPQVSAFDGLLYIFPICCWPWGCQSPLIPW